MAWSYSHYPKQIDVNDTILLSYQETDSEIKMVFDSFALYSLDGFRLNRDRCKLSYLKKNISENQTKAIPKNSEVIDFADNDEHYHRYMLIAPNRQDVITFDVHFSECSFLAESNTFGALLHYGVKSPAEQTSP